MKKFILFLISIILIGVIGVGGVHVYDRYFVNDNGSSEPVPLPKPIIPGDNSNTDNGGNQGGSSDSGNEGTEDGGADNGNTDNGDGEVEGLDDLYIYRTIENGYIDFNRLGRKGFSIYVNGNGFKTFTNLVVNELDFIGTSDAMSIPTGSEMLMVGAPYITYDSVSIQILDATYFNNNLVLVYLTDGDTVPDEPIEDMPGADTPEEPTEPDTPVEPEEPVEETQKLKATYLPNDNFNIYQHEGAVAVDINCACCTSESDDVLNVTSQTRAFTDCVNDFSGLHFERSTDNLKSITFNLIMDADSSKDHRYFPEVTFHDYTNTASFSIQFCCYQNKFCLKVLGGDYNRKSTYNDVIVNNIAWTSADTDSNGITHYGFNAIFKIELNGNIITIYRNDKLFVNIDMTERFERTGFKSIEETMLGLRVDNMSGDADNPIYNIGRWYFHNVVLERDEIDDVDFVSIVSMSRSLTFSLQGYDSFKVKGCQIYTKTSENDFSFNHLFDNNGNIIGSIWREGDNVSINFYKSEFEAYASRVGLSFNGIEYDLPITLMNK